MKLIMAYGRANGEATPPSPPPGRYGRRQHLSSSRRLPSPSTIPLLGVLLHSPFLSGLRVLTPNRLLSSLDVVPNIQRIGSVTAPVMVIHGLADEEIPTTHGRTLADNSNADHPGAEALHWWVEGVGHNDVLEGNMDEYVTKLRGFKEYCESARVKSVGGVEGMVMEREIGEGGESVSVEVEETAAKAIEEERERKRTGKGDPMKRNEF